MSRTNSNMTLRSACKGYCHRSVTSILSDKRAGNDDHHGSERGANINSSGKDPNGNISTESENLSRKTVTSWRFFRRWSTAESNSSLTLPSPVAISAPGNGKVSRFNSYDVERSSGNGDLRSGTSSTARSGIDNNKSSDYSSCDDFDYELGEKTDYTYARSSSYRFLKRSPDTVPFPNMSRRGLKSAYDEYASNLHSRSSSSSDYNRVGNVVYENSFADNNRESEYQNNLFYRDLKYGRETTYKRLEDDVRRNLPFGSDYDSSEEDFETDRKRTYSERQNGKGTFFRLWFNIFDCVVPITTIWEKCWSLIYWMVCSVLVSDSKILTRKVSNKWIFLPSILLLLLLLLALFSRESDGTKEGAFAVDDGPFNAFFTMMHGTANYARVAYLSTISFFAYFRSNRTTESASGKYFLPQKEHVNKLSESKLDREEVEKFIRTVIGREMSDLATKLKSERTLESADLDAHRQRLSALEAQIRGILEEQRVSKRTEIDLTGEPAVNIERIRNLESETRTTKDDLFRLRENQAALERDMRDCCNDTHDAAVIESRVAAVLLQMTGQSPDLRTSEFESFRQWLKSSVVSQVEKLSDEKSRETVDKAEATARSVAAALVRDALKQREQGVGTIRSGGNPSETEVRKIVGDALAIYDADKTGMTDYALESSGGTILSIRCSETYQSGSAQVSYFGIPLWTQTNSPRIVIQPGARPGECWAFKGSEGYLVIQLMGWVRPTAFSLEHVPRSLSPNGNVDSAPKEFSVYGLYKEKDLDGVLLGRYSYDAEGEPLQFFPVADSDANGFPIMELRIHSNHGNLDFTCLYRFRVHGKLVKSEQTQ